jgi:hypothetical protein
MPWFVFILLDLPAMAPTRCIFCLTPGTTGEHLFADWLRVLFPRTPTDTRTVGVTQWGKDIRGKLYAMPQRDIERGHSGSKKIRFVCRGCNNGWMSRMEERTKPILTRLITGVPHFVSTFDQQTLATWVAKTVMVGEYSHPKHIAIPDSERLHMLANLAPPDHWKIWISDYRGNEWSNLAMYHHMGRLSDPGPTETRKPLPPDTHFTSIGMGHLFIQAVASTSGGDFGFDDNSTTPFRLIWPMTSVALNWPPTEPLFDREARYVADSFMRIAGLPHDQQPSFAQLLAIRKPKGE